MNERLKFCMVTTFYPPYSFGGDAMHIYRLTNELARHGHEVDVIHCEDSYALLQRNGDPTGDFPNHDNVKVHKLKSRGGFLSPLLTQQTGAPFLKRNKIKSLLEGKEYDVIHYHNMSLIGITALQYGSGVKLYTMHEHWLVCPMHVLWKFNREVCTKRSCTLCCLKGNRPPQLWRYTGLLDRMLGYVDCFLSPSRFTLNKHLELGLDIPIRHLPYFVPQPKETSETNSEPTQSARRPHFLFVGRLEKIKGLQNLIPIFKERQNYDLLIAGEGDYLAELRNLAGASPNIQFLGKLSPSKLQRLYREAVAVIVPSICYETFGIIIIEAFAQKTPVIVNNLGALPEVVSDSGGGLIYNDQAELVRSMERLATDRTLRDDLGRKGHAAYLKYWTEDAHLREYLAVINEVREKHRQKLSVVA